MKEFLLQCRWCKSRYPTWRYWPKLSKRAELRYWLPNDGNYANFFE